uniref:Kazal-like domain-containing protein n=1 Tax=Canis lupus dingo TaxID=286419 RepID=A0A8C0LFN5_CANLU
CAQLGVFLSLSLYQTIMATSFFCSSWQDQCHEFRSMVREGKLICTRENNPVRGPDGKMHVNKCAIKKNDEEKSSAKPSDDAKVIS